MGPTRKLTELTPAFKDNVLVFDCPCDRCRDIRENPDAQRNQYWCDGRVRIPIAPQPHGWNLVSGEYPETITLQPSIRIGLGKSHGGCDGWHGYLTNGVLVACE